MIIIDYFFYLTYTFLIRTGRNEEQAKWSALIHTSLYSSFFIDIILYSTALVCNRTFFTYYFSLAFWKRIFILYSILITFSYIRFYKSCTLNKIQNRFPQINIKWPFFLLTIFIPILEVIVVRLYTFGHL